MDMDPIDSSGQRYDNAGQTSCVVHGSPLEGGVCDVCHFDNKDD